MYDNFLANGEYLAERFKIINQHYLEFCAKTFNHWICTWKHFLHILKRILNEKYPSVAFEFYLSTCAKNVHMALDYNLLTLHDHDEIIFDVKEVWLETIQDTSFKFVVLQLIHTTKWKFDYIVCRKYTDSSDS